MTQRLITSFIPLISLIFSTFAFVFTLKNEREKRFKLRINFFNSEPLSEWIVDRTEDTVPDGYWQDNYRLILPVVITNESSLPVTVINFKLNNQHIFAIDSDIENTYKVTQNNKSHLRRVFKVSEKDKLLQPVFTIGPFEAVVGYVVFHYNKSQLGNNTLTINTSRGPTEVKFKLHSVLESKLKTDYEPPHEYFL